MICEAQAELKKIAAKETKEFQLFPEYTEDLYNRIDEIAHADLDEACPSPRSCRVRIASTKSRKA